MDISTVSSILNLIRFLKPLINTFQPASTVAARLSTSTAISAASLCTARWNTTAAAPKTSAIIKRICSVVSFFFSFEAVSFTLTPSSMLSQICCISAAGCFFSLSNRSSFVAKLKLTFS